MESAALPQNRLDALNAALAQEVRSTRDILEAATRLGATILATRGDTWLCEFRDGRARLWRATDKDGIGELDEFDGFDDQIAGFGHRHFCLNCEEPVEEEVFDCEADYDHGFALCEECTRAGVRPRDA
jgi:hypothetical protein